MSSRWDPRFPAPSRPIDVDDGLKARSRSGEIARTWWSKRFIEVLSGMGMGNRLQRGRAYARRGQVLSLDVAPGLVVAEVQGSRTRPYRVRIGLTAFGKAEWAAVERELAENAWFLAKLLAGEMPDDIEDVFTAVGLSLFPTTARELTLDCSCPDAAVPCKHLAAVFYLLAESFDDDPFAILAWRGRERGDLLDHLHAARGSGDPSGADESSAPPLADLLDGYFTAPSEIVRTPPPALPPDALLDQLPPVSVAVRGVGLVELLRPAYVGMGEGRTG